VEVLAPATFCAPSTWRERAKTVVLPESPDVTVIVPHPHDVLIAKLGRLTPQDDDHVRRILAELPMDRATLERLASQSPYRTRKGEDPDGEAAFELHVREVAAKLPQ
jgi:hypothetical protein